MLRDVDLHGWPHRDPDRERRMERWAVICGVLSFLLGLPAAFVIFALWAGL